MKTRFQQISYFLNWVLIGLVTGLGVLLVMGEIQVSLLGQTFGTHSATAQNQQNSYSQAVSLAAPAVVSIRTLRLEAAMPKSEGERLLERFFGLNSPHRPKTKTTESAGSGVILDSNGYILTNYHVINKSDYIHITLNDGRSAKAKLIGQDPETDLAMLKISLDNLPQARIADITKLKVGDVVLAIGYPFQLGQTVTQGIISATGRTRVSTNTYENFLQTDAAINRGNSGGALINAAGEIVGINSNIYTETGSFSGIGFAIPIDLALDVLNQIAANGYVVRGWLGVEGVELTRQILKKIGLQNVRGILLTSIDINGPGYKAGLKPGDIISHINKKPIVEIADIMNLIAAGKPGDIFMIDGVRMRESFNVEATLGERPLSSN